MKKMIVFMLFALCSIPMMAQNDVYDQPEVQAQFVGGQQAFREWLMENVVYPKEAQVRQLRGRVIVQFVIDKEGNVTSPTILKSIDPILDKAALKLVKKMPKWIPGTVAGRPVAVRYTLPINYSY